MSLYKVGSGHSLLARQLLSQRFLHPPEVNRSAPMDGASDRYWERRTGNRELPLPVLDFLY